MLQNKKGFTLVELLAVIVILGIILAIAVPTVTGIINNQRESAFEATARMIYRGIQYEMLEDGAENTIIPAGSYNSSNYGATDVGNMTIRANGNVDLTGSPGGKFNGCTISDDSIEELNADC